jgi:hypothetical protein
LFDKLVDYYQKQSYDDNAKRHTTTRRNTTMTNNQKPVAKLIEANGNIFNLIGLASQALKRAGQQGQANKMAKEVMACENYHEALATIANYVEVE